MKDIFPQAKTVASDGWFKKEFPKAFEYGWFSVEYKTELSVDG